MTRFKLTIEYDGAPFVGWQRQENGPSVQGALEAALKAFAGHDVPVIAAGRTDAGVHARGQVVHGDIAKDLDADTVRDAANAHLRPHPISVLKAEAAAADFHARFDAVRRTYDYVIAQRRAPLALERGRAWLIPQPLDVPAMATAAQSLVGRHDFTTFRAAECQAPSPVKTLEAADISVSGEFVTLRFSARSFLHSQVRSMVGSLVQVGRGRWPVDGVKAALEARRREACGPLAPPAGLYLMRVDYG